MNLQYLKKKNLFDDPEDSSIPEVSQDGSIDDSSDDEESTETSPDDEESEDPQEQETPSRFSKLYGEAVSKPAGPNNKKLNDYLDEDVPQKSDFKVSKTNRLAAILGGASEGFQHGAGAGIKTASDVLDTPYEEGVARYTQRGKNLSNAAVLEDKGMGRAASFAKTAEASERDAAKLKEQKKKDEVDRMYKNAQVTKMQHPNAIFKNVNGRVMAIDPTNPEHSLDLGDANLLSPDALKQKKSLEQWNSGLIEQRETKLEGQKQAGENTRQDKGITAAAKRQAVTLEHSDNTPQTQNAEHINALREAYAKYGSRMDDFVIKDPNSKLPIGLKHPESNDPKVLADYAAVVQQLYGKQ